MTAQMIGQPPREPRKTWKILLYLVALGANLFAVGMLVGQVLRGGDFTLPGLIGVVLSGVFAAFLFVELRKPKG